MNSEIDDPIKCFYDFDKSNQMSNTIQSENNVQDNDHSLHVDSLSEHSKINDEGKGNTPTQKDSNQHHSENSITQFRPDKLPLKSVKVYSPHIKESMVNSYILYKVGFIWNDKEFEVTRRYSDFKALRKALGHVLPFTFLFPMHRKQVIVGSQGKFEEGFHPGPQAGA